MFPWFRAIFFVHYLGYKWLLGYIYKGGSFTVLLRGYGGEEVSLLEKAMLQGRVACFVGFLVYAVDEYRHGSGNVVVLVILV